MTRTRPPQNGFTLMEVLIVIAVIGILAAVVLPSSAPSTTDQLRAAARMVGTELAYARSLAVSNNSTYRVTFDTKNNRMVVEHSGSDPLLDVLPDSPFRHHDDPPTEQILDLDDLPHVGAPARLLTAAAFQGSMSRIHHIEFGPLGGTTSSRWGVLWLACGHGNEERYAYLVINPITGMVDPGQVTEYGPPSYLLTNAPTAVKAGI